MTNPGPVVVGIDFSDGAASAVAWAEGFSRLSGSTLLLVHAADGPRGGPTGTELRWLETAGVQPASLVVRHGLPWVEIARFADEVGAAMLVIGSHGARGYHALLPGSTTTLLVTRVRRPVVVVPAVSGGNRAGHSPFTEIAR